MEKYVIKYGDLYILNVGTVDTNFLTENIDQAFIWNGIEEAKLWLETASFYTPANSNKFEYINMLESLD